MKLVKEFSNYDTQKLSEPMCIIPSFAHVRFSCIRQYDYNMFYLYYISNETEIKMYMHVLSLSGKWLILYNKFGIKLYELFRDFRIELNSLGHCSGWTLVFPKKKEPGRQIDKN